MKKSMIILSCLISLNAQGMLPLAKIIGIQAIISSSIVYYAVNFQRLKKPQKAPIMHQSNKETKKTQITATMQKNKLLRRKRLLAERINALNNLKAMQNELQEEQKIKHYWDQEKVNRALIKLKHAAIVATEIDNAKEIFSISDEKRAQILQ